MNGPPLDLKLGSDGVFEQQFAEMCDADDAAADLLRGQIEAFARAPQNRGFFVRGAQDGRKRYLVPAGCGNGLMERAVALVEVWPDAGVAVLIRLYKPDQSSPNTIRQTETRRADQDFGI